MLGTSSTRLVAVTTASASTGDGRGPGGRHPALLAAALSEVGVRPGAPTNKNAAVASVLTAKPAALPNTEVLLPAAPAAPEALAPAAAAAAVAAGPVSGNRWRPRNAMTCGRTARTSCFAEITPRQTNMRFSSRGLLRVPVAPGLYRHGLAVQQVQYAHQHVCGGGRRLTRLQKALSGAHEVGQVGSVHADIGGVGRGQGLCTAQIKRQRYTREYNGGGD